MNKYNLLNLSTCCLTLYVLFGGFSYATAGVCWKTSDSSSGLCRRAIIVNITREECCSIQGLSNVSWSPHTSLSDVFYLNYFAGGAGQCARCHPTCLSVTCRAGRTCQMRSGRPVCVCKPRCSAAERRRGPVCGSDERRYRSVCSLQAHNCINDVNVYVKYHGRCRRSCKRIQCGEDKRCLEDQNGLPHCVQCSTQCTRSDKSTGPVCGVNGLTYASTCHLQAAICKKGRSIQMAYQGKCRVDTTCEDVLCKENETCILNPGNGQPVCLSCDLECHQKEKQALLCGTDGQTYRSYCEMMVSACRQRQFVTTLKNGACPTDNVQKNITLGEFQTNLPRIKLENNTNRRHKRHKSNNKNSVRHKRKQRNKKRQRQNKVRRKIQKVVKQKRLAMSRELTRSAMANTAVGMTG